MAVDRGRIVILSLALSIWPFPFDGKDQVAVRQPDGGLEWRAVVLGVSNDAMTEVKSGLKSGDIVALKPEALLGAAQKRQLAASPTAPASPPRENPDPGRRPRRR